MQFFKFRNSPNFRAKPRTPEVLEFDYLLSSRRPRPPLLAAAAALRTRPRASKFTEPFPTLSGYQAWVLIQPGQRQLQEDPENQTCLWPGRPPGIPGRRQGAAAPPTGRRGKEAGVSPFKLHPKTGPRMGHHTGFFPPDAPYCGKSNLCTSEPTSFPRAWEYRGGCRHGTLESCLFRERCRSHAFVS